MPFFGKRKRRFPLPPSLSSSTFLARDGEVGVYYVFSWDFEREKLVTVICFPEKEKTWGFTGSHCWGLIGRKKFGTAAASNAALIAFWWWIRSSLSWLLTG